MAHDIILMRTERGIVAYDALSASLINDLPINKPLKAKISQPRNLKHHRQAYALFHLIFENQELYPTLEKLVMAIKLATGLCETMMLGSKEVYVPSSIAFDKMDQKQFSEWWERVIVLVCERIIPGMDSPTLEKEVNEILIGNSGYVAA